MNNKPLKLALNHPGIFTKDFLEWLPANEHMYNLFENLADQLWLSGRRHYSSRTIGEKMRFDYGLKSVGDTFKLRNAFTPDLGRLYVLKHPKRVLLFSYTQQRQPDFVKYICRTFDLTIWTTD